MVDVLHNMVDVRDVANTKNKLTCLGQIHKGAYYSKWPKYHLYGSPMQVSLLDECACLSVGCGYRITSSTRRF